MFNEVLVYAMKA